MQLQESFQLLVISYTHSKTILMIKNKSKNAESCENNPTTVGQSAIFV